MRQLVKKTNYHRDISLNVSGNIIKGADDVSNRFNEFVPTIVGCTD